MHTEFRMKPNFGIRFDFRMKLHVILRLDSILGSDLSQGGHGTGKTGNLAVNLSR